MPKDNSRAVAEVLNAVIQKMSELDEQDRGRVLTSVATFFRHELQPAPAQPTSASSSQPAMRPNFSDDRAPSPKDFLFQKQPKTDVERIACLAFFLTHFRDMPHFKTIDLAKLNTEAAQIKFSNTAYATNNAIKSGHLALASKGLKQITAWGEQFVSALPDRDAAQKILSQLRHRRGRGRKK